MATTNQRPATRGRLSRAAVGFGLAAALAVGCQGRGDVSGKVTYQGKAVPFGTVLIEASDGSACQGNIEQDGTYTVQAWHHHFREPLTRAVNVVAGRAEVNFQFDAALAMN